MIDIIILTWNGLKHTKNCINSILATVKSPFSLIFVDNGSTDGTRNWIGQLINKFNCSEKKGNLKRMWMIEVQDVGFAEACNIGIKESKGDIIILCNNDIVCAPGALDNLANAMRNNPKFVIMAATTNFCGQPLQRFDNHRQVKPAVIESPDVNYVCVAIKKSFWEKYPMNEEYISGWEDTSHSWTARKKAGMKVGVCLASFVYHVGSATNKKQFGTEGMKKNFSIGQEIFIKEWKEEGRLRVERGY